MATDAFQLSLSDIYVAVCMEHFIMVIKENLPYGHTIWVYNLYTEEGRKHSDLPKYGTPSFRDACAVALGPDVYLFGGLDHGKTVSNLLLKLIKQSDGHFVINEMTGRNYKLPSPRRGHTGWAFDEKLWIFGGHGVPESGYLDAFGRFKKEDGFHMNNQLLCFDPTSLDKWRNPQCFGAVPSPHTRHATTITRDKVILFGACGSNYLSDLYELNMCSLTWTEIQTGHIKPPGRVWSSSTTSSEGGHLVLHGGSGTRDFNDTWIFNLESQSWTEYTKYKNLPCNHMCFTGPHSVVVIGSARHKTGPTIHIMSLPKSLQQLSIQTINRHWETMPKNCLPQKLLALFSRP